MGRETKIVRVVSKCHTCNFSIEWEPVPGLQGMFQIPDAYCPNDLMLLNQQIKFVDSNEDSNGS